MSTTSEYTTTMSESKLIRNARRLGRVYELAEDIRHDLKKADKDSPLIKEISTLVESIESIPKKCSGLDYSKNRFESHKKSLTEKKASNKR